MYHGATYECDKCGLKSTNEHDFWKCGSVKSKFWHFCSKCVKEFNKIVLDFIKHDVIVPKQRSLFGYMKREDT